MPQIAVHLCQQTSIMANHLLLLPWCIAITGYWISSAHSNNQQQPTAGYKQTTKTLPDGDKRKSADKNENHYKHNKQLIIQES